ncbi:MAG: GNAT family N-acetyltransferase [Lentimicrobiaceae bacterium]|nr:GNAT family N-acetyltransferase [Lentimicrobiaceae bacterium]MCO5264677.1 GNAT family N-acetyltransferase [Lentimicrobium sp.]HPG33373.1 GNAT family N-acetyltransferase [Lentimicrobium sp.]
MLSQTQTGLLLVNSDQNISILCMDEEYPLLEVQQEGPMLMCRFQSDEEWCHFSYNSTSAFLAGFLKLHPGRQYVVVSDDSAFSWLKLHCQLIWSINCYRLFQENEIPAGDGTLVVPLLSEHLPLVYDNSKYQQFLSMDYLQKRLESGGGFCICNAGMPVAWIMTHDDGSVGMLHVLDAFRHRGYARRLIEAMSARVRQKGRRVFAHIEPSNEASLQLFTSMGFAVKASVTWALVRKFIKA